jgi:hypothetical protein
MSSAFHKLNWGFSPMNSQKIFSRISVTITQCGRGIHILGQVVCQFQDLLAVLRHRTVAWIIKCASISFQNVFTDLQNFDFSLLSACFRTAALLNTGLTNLWHDCPKLNKERFSCHSAFTAVPIFSFAKPCCIMNNIYVCIYIHNTWQCIDYPFCQMMKWGNIFSILTGQP